jgi:uncharacterized protein (DUF2235 family)
MAGLPRPPSSAYDFYRDTTIKPDDRRGDGFPQHTFVEIGIHFIGVWDTVGSLGIPDTASWFPFARSRYQFHDTELSKIVKYAYQALALDEHRADFAPTVWTRNPYSVKPGETLTSKKVEQIEIEQRWFIGSHADVGGGNDRDGAGRKPDPLPDLPLAWLQQKAIAVGLACERNRHPWTRCRYWRATQFLRWNSCMASTRNSSRRLIARWVTASTKSGRFVWQRWLSDATYRSPSLAQALTRAVVLMS